MTEIAAEEGETRSLLHIVLIAAALIILGGGFIYLIYSTVEDIVAVREGRASRSYGSEQSTKNLAQSNTVILPVETGVPTRRSAQSQMALLSGKYVLLPALRS